GPASGQRLQPSRESSRGLRGLLAAAGRGVLRTGVTSQAASALPPGIGRTPGREASEASAGRARIALRGRANCPLSGQSRAVGVYAARVRHRRAAVQRLALESGAEAGRLRRSVVRGLRG